MEKCDIKIYDKDNKELNYDILIRFTFDNSNYIVYTDNLQNEKGEFNLYGAKLDINNKLEEVTDVDVLPLFEEIIEDYNEKIRKDNNNDN